MQRIEFTSEEVEVLRQLLQHATTEMDVEVFRTDSIGFKQLLKHRRQVLERILEKVAAAPVQV